MNHTRGFSIWGKIGYKAWHFSITKTFLGNTSFDIQINPLDPF